MEEWGLEYSVDMYSVLRSQDTFLACCFALGEEIDGGRGGTVKGVNAGRENFIVVGFFLQ